MWYRPGSGYRFYRGYDQNSKWSQKNGHPLSKSNVMKFSEEKMQNPILKRCDQAQMWQNIHLRKSRAQKMWAMMDHKLNKSQPDAKSTQAKSHALKKRGNLTVNVLAYH